MRRIFKAEVDSNGTVKISSQASIEELLLSITAIIRSIYNMDHINDFEKFLYKKFVQEELPTLAFMSSKELEENAEEQRKKNIKKMSMCLKGLKELFELLEDVDDEGDENS